MNEICFVFLLTFIIVGSCWLSIENMSIKNYEKRDLIDKIKKYIDKEK